ncbi:MAG: hypothetical protein DCC52_13075 [Chloroflexi bacterium]|nr:MAG: hypothetical protein DCC52_13075 [Chloroflexota bacterium]
MRIKDNSLGAFFKRIIFIPLHRKPIYDWVTTLEQLWGERFERLDEVLRELEKESKYVSKK